jgi:hypothetical protein
MNELNIKQEKINLQKKIETWVTTAKKHFDTTPCELNEQVLFLTKFRKAIYEDLNQLQHKALIIESAEILQKEYPKINKWKWHPEQTSHPDEADLMGYTDDKIIISAEVTTSMLPVGTIDTRMRKTLDSLKGKPGERFYFVRSKEMLTRSETKISNNNWDITSRLL